jgi:hypothetical protein
MEVSNGHDSYLSVVCHDFERSFRWIYIGVLSIPFLIVAISYTSSAMGHSGQFDPTRFKTAVIFFLVAGVLIALSIRIKGFRYFLLIDRAHGQFNYHKDNLFSTVHIKGDVSQIKEIYVKEGSYMSDSLVKTNRTIYKVGMRYLFQEIVVYMSLHQDHAMSMASSISGFVEAPLSSD